MCIAIYIVYTNNVIFIHMYGLYPLGSVEHLSYDLLQEFLAEGHVMRHKLDIWNGIWSDMVIASIFMRYGHEYGGLIRQIRYHLDRCDTYLIFDRYINTNIK